MDVLLNKLTAHATSFCQNRTSPGSRRGCRIVEMNFQREYSAPSTTRSADEGEEGEPPFAGEHDCALNLVEMQIVFKPR